MQNHPPDLQLRPKKGGLHANREGDYVYGGQKHHADPQPEGRYSLRRAKTSREGEKSTTNTTKPPSPCKTTLPIQNHPPNLQLRPKKEGLHLNREGDTDCGGQKHHADPQPEGRYSLRRAKTSREGEKSTTNTTKPPSPCKTTLPMQNHPP